ncbi:ATP-binding protein [Dactylosporangium sp. CA-152071]|uniref:sensor histidine kinase n=1 Tax=Dactylosporangium sp. CA-152071 TaxID=3239933 RepID=UPI003D94CA25
MARGQLRVYLGAAPGVGKTYKMLEEGHRRQQRGTDVVVGFVETHGRPFTEAMLTGLRVIPRRAVAYRGAEFTEMDLDAVLAARPEVAVVDELAHTNVPGGGHAKRFQDIETLLDAGITVLTTVNIQHLESLNDVVQQITGVPQRETVPDAVVRRAEQIELVDMTPEALRRRMAHGNIYRPEKVDAALGNYFRVGNLTALRELALLWLADKVDDQLDRYRAEHHIDATWEARERVVVALTGGPEGDTLIRRAARVAARTKAADLLAVHVIRGDGLAGADPANLARQRVLVETLGGTYHQVVGNDVPAALLDFARGVNATQLVLGASRRNRFAQVLSPGVGVTTTAGSGSIDVHLVTHEQARRGRLRHGGPGGLTLRRRLAGVALAGLGLPLLTVGLTAVQADISLPSDILAFLILTVAVALVGGLWPALLAAVGSFLLLNYYFTPPLHRFTVAERENLFALLAFVLVAAAVSTVVDLAARRTREAAQARAEAQTLSTLAGGVLHGDRPLPALLERVREAFGLTSVTLLQRRTGEDAGPEPRGDKGAWQIAATVGGQPCTSPADGQSEVPIDEDLSLVLRGPILAAADRRLVEAFAAHAAIALRQQRLAEQAAAAGNLAEVDRLRTALLSAVSHDLRTPLAAAKAAVGSLRSPDVEFSAEDREELLATAEESLDKLNRLVENLLDMSRLQAGALGMHPRAISVGEAIPRGIDDLGDAAAGVRVIVPDELPEIHADPALLERILVNVLANALRHSPADRPPLITVSEHAGLVEVRVVDHGPGVPAADRDRIFQPFQRLGDRDNTTGVGLGLALSRGLAEAMGGSLEPENTPGGGLTITLTLRTAELDARRRSATPDERADPALLDRLDAYTHDHRTGSPSDPGSAR